MIGHLIAWLLSPRVADVAMAYVFGGEDSIPGRVVNPPSEHVSGSVMFSVPDEAAAISCVVLAAAGRRTNDVLKARMTEIVIGEWGCKFIHKDSWPHGRHRRPMTVIVYAGSRHRLDAVCSPDCIGPELSVIQRLRHRNVQHPGLRCV